MADSKEPKKETVRITLPPRASSPTTGGAAPARDTVRINMPARPPGNGAPLRPVPVPPPAVGAAPPRPPTAHAPLPPPPSKKVTPPPFFPPKPPPSAAATTAARPAPAPAPLLPKTLAQSVPASIAQTLPAPGPKKETARITVLPDPPAKPAGAVQMKKTQPLTTMPEPALPVSPVRVAPTPTIAPVVSNGIPMSLCWVLLGVSAIVLLVQIWIYFG